jgi:hypothetical protein
MFVILMIFIPLFMTSCSSAASPAAVTDQPRVSATIRIANQESSPTGAPSIAFSVSDTAVQYSREGITLMISKPETWDAIDTAEGVVVSKRFATVESPKVHEGLTAYTFFTPAEHLTTDISNTEHPAHAVLVNVSTNAASRRIANRTEVTSFKWDGYDAAYYLLSGDDRTVSYVVSVMVPDGSQGILLSSIVSAPYEERDRISEQLPMLMNHMRLNRIHLSGEPFEAIAARMEFPALPDPSLTVTSEVTAESTTQ